MAVKSIKTILKLSTNPHYKLTDEEIQVLREYQESQQDQGRHRNVKTVDKHSYNMKKHSTELENE